MRSRCGTTCPALGVGLLFACWAFGSVAMAQVPASDPAPDGEAQTVQLAAAAADGDLFAELAQSQQRIQLLQDELNLLRRRLRESAGQLQDAQRAREDAERTLRSLQASLSRGGGAMIRANNSLRPDLPSSELAGIEVRQDGDVLRLEIPADQLFSLGTAQLLPTAPAVIDQIAELIQRDYPEQMIGIEGHTDGMPAATTVSGHALGASQAVAVFDVLTQRTRLPARQLFVVAHGPNHPLVSNATPAGRAKNRRIEVVIYPEQIANR